MHRAEPPDGRFGESVYHALDRGVLRERAVDHGDAAVVGHRGEEWRGGDGTGERGGTDLLMARGAQVGFSSPGPIGICEH